MDRVLALGYLGLSCKCGSGDPRWWERAEVVHPSSRWTNHVTQRLVHDHRKQPMKHTARKMSEILKEMAESLLRDPDSSSSEADHVALLFAHVAWNQSVGLDAGQQDYHPVMEAIENENPELWNELTSNDINAMIRKLVRYKKKHYPDDRRRILVCGMIEGKIRVEWLQPADPGVDSNWEMQLYGLVRMGQHERAIEFVEETSGMSRLDAAAEVTAAASRLEGCL